mgnify:CR=1 FL=1
MKKHRYQSNAEFVTFVLSFAFKAIVYCLFMVAGPLYAAQSFSLGATINGSGWNGDNRSTGTRFESNKGGQFALSGSYRRDKFYTGVNLQGGDYTFADDAPDQITSLGTISSNNTVVEHNELDLLAGYYFWPNVSLFLDLKGVTSKWSNGYLQNLTGLGVGVSAFRALKPDWIVFGSLGFVNGDIKEKDKSRLGRGSSNALVLGTVYTLKPRQHLNFGIKLRNYEFDYDNGQDQRYSINALFIGYNHVFDW